MDIDPQKLFIREEDAFAYEPKGHGGTVNRRLVGPEQGATHLEAVLGTVQPGEGATPHLHPGIDQFCYMLEGTAEVEVGDVVRRIGKGDTCFFPADIRHIFTAVGDTPVRVLIVYGPPYGEGARIDG